MRGRRKVLGQAKARRARKPDARQSRTHAKAGRTRKPDARGVVTVGVNAMIRRTGGGFVPTGLPLSMGVASPAVNGGANLCRAYGAQETEMSGFARNVC